MEDYTKTPIQQLTKEQFNTVYENSSKKYENTTKFMSREQVLFAALTTGQITPEKYNELI